MSQLHATLSDWLRDLAICAGILYALFAIIFGTVRPIKLFKKCRREFHVNYMGTDPSDTVGLIVRDDLGEFLKGIPISAWAIRFGGRSMEAWEPLFPEFQIKLSKLREWADNLPSSRFRSAYLRQIRDYELGLETAMEYWQKVKAYKAGIEECSRSNTVAKAPRV